MLYSASVIFNRNMAEGFQLRVIERLDGKSFRLPVFTAFRPTLTYAGPTIPTLTYTEVGRSTQS
jgi:hypothetical protein